ncbi:hypothetical protein OHA25_46205 [Nonomuraea sp. NBC_00507]
MRTMHVDLAFQTRYDLARGARGDPATPCHLTTASVKDAFVTASTA